MIVFIPVDPSSIDAIPVFKCYLPACSPNILPALVPFFCIWIVQYLQYRAKDRLTNFLAEIFDRAFQVCFWNVFCSGSRFSPDYYRYNYLDSLVCRVRVPPFLLAN